VADRFATPPPPAPPVAHARARIAGVTARDRDDPRLPDLRRDLEAAKLEEHVRQVVAAAPPLTPEQVDRLTSLLRPPVTPATAGSTRTRRPKAAPAQTTAAPGHEPGANGSSKVLVGGTDPSIARRVRGK
jgi:hypothetical protein